MTACTLFCIPYAGGSAAEYKDWQQSMDPSIAVVPVELPGRGTRANEPMYATMEEAARDLCEFVQHHNDGRPYAIYGHSMGAILAFEAARLLRHRNADDSPLLLFVSGRNPPHVPRREGAALLHELDDEAFMDEIIKFGGFPEDLLAHRNLFRLFLPMLRGDYVVSEQYEFREDPAMLDCPVSVLYGTKDHSYPEVMSQWQRYTTGQCTLQGYEGGHFFIHDYKAQVVGRINRQVLDALMMRSYV